MQQLSPDDAVFLAIETRECPAHIGGLAILDPSTHPEEGFDFDAFVEHVARRIELCPRFTWALQEVPLGLDRPYWLEHGGFDLEDHIHRMALPAPGGQRELAELANLLFPQPLDRARPLWEMTWIEGLQGGRVGLLWKIHHALMDGGSGAGLVELLFDLEPVPAEKPLVAIDDDARGGAPVATATVLSNAVRNGLGRPPAVLRHLSAAGRDLVGRLRSDSPAMPAMAPRTSFNGAVGSRRAIAWSRVSLERVKQLKDRLGVSVNDVALALTSGAVRSYLAGRDELPEESLVAAVPVSLRREGDKALGNQITEVNVAWATDVEDPIERIYAIHDSAAAATTAARSGSFNLPQALAETLVPGALSLMMRATAAQSDQAPLPCNAVVSNVRMSPIPIYVAGAKIESMVPISILAPTQGMNITLISYLGELHFGVVADPERVESVWEVADGIPKALGELEEAAEKDPRFAI